MHAGKQTDRHVLLHGSHVLSSSIVVGSQDINFSAIRDAAFVDLSDCGIHLNSAK